MSIALRAYFLYHEGLEWAVLIGAIMIFGGNYYNIRQKEVRKDRALVYRKQTTFRNMKE